MDEGERREFDPSEFEEPELPTEPAEAEPPPEFEEIDEKLIAKFARLRTKRSSPPTKRRRPACC